MKSKINRLIERKAANKLLGWTAVAVSLTLSAQVRAQGEDSAEPRESEPAHRALTLRPHVGIGWADGYGESTDGLAIHAGGRVLFPAPLSPKVGARFGLEATYVELDVRSENELPERYVAVGIVLEMTLFRNFLMGIGSVGYVGLGSTDRNPFGIVTNLGWEPARSSRVVPFITFRSEWVFDQVVFNILSLSAGFTLGI